MNRFTKIQNFKKCFWKFKKFQKLGPKMLILAYFVTKPGQKHFFSFICPFFIYFEIVFFLNLNNLGQKRAQNRPKNICFHLSVYFFFHFENNFFFEISKIWAKKGPKNGPKRPKKWWKLKKIIVIIFLARNYTT